ncbi:MAG TPA: response regulator, partial [Longimicrobiaceae bacterium]|nr:response regulator [Longimicrobiaceae bacterium]
MSFRFLLVEDNQDIASILVPLLEQLGEPAEVRVASSSGEAVRTLRGFMPDLMVVDLILGEEDFQASLDSVEHASGFRFIADCHFDPRTSHIPVLVITGLHLESRDSVRLRRLAVADILSKPFAMSAFLKAIIPILDAPQNPDAALVRVGSESQSLDYKEVIDLSSKSGRAGLAKDV